MDTLNKTELLKQIAQIRLMERGTLSVYTHKDRSPDAGPYHKLQCWENGKNQTRYIPPEQLALVREALEGYGKFQELTKQLAQLCIDETRQRCKQLSGLVKKKTQPRN